MKALLFDKDKFIKEVEMKTIMDRIAIPMMPNLSLQETGKEDIFILSNQDVYHFKNKINQTLFYRKESIR